MAWPWRRPGWPVAVDATGQPLSPQGLAAQVRGRRVCLCLPPGLVLLRRFSGPGLPAREQEAGARLLAEESLPEEAGAYYLGIWRISADELGLAALPRDPLRRARAWLEQAGARLAGVAVAELLPPGDPRPGVRLWHTAGGLLVCRWQDRVLRDWLVPSWDLDPNAVLRLSLPGETSPAWVEMAPEQPGALARAVARRWPAAERRALPAPEANPRPRLPPGVTFDDFLREEQRRPATARDKRNLSFALAAALVAGLSLFFAQVTDLERRVARLRQEVSLLKVRAHRSEQLAVRAGDSLTRIRDLRRLTVERPGVLRALKALTETLPAGVRLEGLGIERSGAVAIDGLAEAEVDVSNFLERLGQSPAFREPRLAFTQRDERQQPVVIRFRVETRLPEPLLTLPGAEG